MGGKEVKEQRDFDILNKMKKTTGRTCHYSVGHCCSARDVRASGLSDWWVCNSTFLRRKRMYDGIFPDRVWIYNQYQTSWHAAV